MIKVLKTKTDLQLELGKLKKNGLKVGLIPTMGALHDGHLSLIHLAKKQTDIIVCSIFVNPTQFTNAEDLKKYPRTLESDVEMLEQAGTDLVFAPEIEEMYEDDEKWYFELADLDTIMEGKFRIGHFQGVTQIVYKLFLLVKPDIAFFGQKDFQQFAVIQKMVEDFHMDLKLVCAPTIRDERGLALSSRNSRLSKFEKEKATILSKALFYFKAQKGKGDFTDSLHHAIKLIEKTQDVKLEYFEVRDTGTLKKAADWNSYPKLVVCVAAKFGSIRLLDNVIIE